MNIMWKQLSTLLFFVGACEVSCLSIEAKADKPLSNTIFEVGEANDEAKDVSIIALIANPEHYQGKPVRVIGAINVEYENQSICLSQQDVINSIFSNCLWLATYDSSLGLNERALLPLNGHYVLIEGIFNRSTTGHMNAWPAGISSISRIREMPNGKWMNTDRVLTPALPAPQHR